MIKTPEQATRIRGIGTITPEATPVKMSPIDEASNRLIGRLEYTLEHIEELGKRLSPVVSCEEAELVQPNDTKPVQPTCDMIVKLNTALNLAESIDRRISSLNARCQL